MPRSRDARPGRFQTSPRSRPCVYFSRPAPPFAYRQVRPLASLLVRPGFEPIPYRSDRATRPSQLQVSFRFPFIVSRSAHSSADRARLSLFAVLLFTDVLHPVDVPSADRFLNGDVRHSSRRRGAVPVLDARRNSHHIARPDFLYPTAPLLDASGAGGDEQDLAGRMGVPCGAGTGLKRDQAAGRARRGRGGGKGGKTDPPPGVPRRGPRGTVG